MTLMTHPQRHTNENSVTKSRQTNEPGNDMHHAKQPSSSTLQIFAIGVIYHSNIWKTQLPLGKARQSVSAVNCIWRAAAAQLKLTVPIRVTDRAANLARRKVRSAAEKYAAHYKTRSVVHTTMLSGN